ncbi:MAG TPA: hypothetical protein VGQ99_05710 [Tepidisphaeraceae bacterium]|jgi:hypothetical protein|nr:hypothetical protein [Tepidisphaeraceae bacterium]
MSLDSSNDPMVEQVHQIRRQIAEQCGNDIDKLAEHLRQIGRDYAQRRGIFATVTHHAAAKVETSWGDMSAPPDDRLVDEIRSIRTATAAKASSSKKPRKKNSRS